MDKKTESDHENMLDRIIEDGKLKVETHSRESSTRREFSYLQNGYLTNSLRFADAKAGALVAVNGLIVKFIIDFQESSLLLIEILFKVGIFIIIVGILLALIVVFPTKKNSSEKGIIYWEHIKNLGKDKYVKSIKDGPVENFLIKSIENNYTQATILTEKFNKLSLAFLISLGGYGAVFLGLMLMFIFQ